MTSSLDYSWLGGAIADLPTPFDTTGGLDLPALARLIERQIDAGATALVVGETMGEMATLTIDEHDVLVRTAVATSRGRIVRPGASCTIIGSDVAAAMARKCPAMPAWVGLL